MKQFNIIFLIGFVLTAGLVVTAQEKRFELDGQIIYDQLTGLSWQAKDDGQERTWFDAKSYCQNLSLGGKSNWRLPQIQELLSITDSAKDEPAADAIFSARSSYYWSSSVNANVSFGAWHVGFELGGDYWGLKSSKYYVRCVLSGS